MLKLKSIFTNEGKGIPLEDKSTALLILSYLNSTLVQKLVNLYGSIHHKTSGSISLLPLMISDKNKIIVELTERILTIKRKWFSIDETTAEFRGFLNHFSGSKSLEDAIRKLANCLREDLKSYNDAIDENDSIWLENTQFSQQLFESYQNYSKKRPFENLISIDGVTDKTFTDNSILSYEIVSNLLGVAFGRWDIRNIINPELIPKFGDFFDQLPFIPAVSLPENLKGYPLDITAKGILVGDINNPVDITKALKKVIITIWGNNADNIINELEEMGQFYSIESFIANPNGFFDFHYRRYTKSRREAPIYWPISTPSSSYTIWLYYPKLNNQTLYKVVNDFITPKQEEISDAAKKLELNPTLDNNGKKELRELKDLMHELQEMETGLLQVASLPYKPNHDDGVLITAAPLYKFFRHAKWRKATEDCWTALEKGEYDWSHLAYSIWSDRVTKKCKKDLSMAIAHGLEEICEVKPKEKRAKSPKPTKKAEQNKLIQ